MDSNINNIELYEETGFYYTISLISGKHKPVILHCLSECGVARFSGFQRYIKGASDKTLSRSLKELERDGLINRNDFHVIPPKVEYSLTEKGKSLMKILEHLDEWGNKNKEAE